MWKSVALWSLLVLTTLGLQAQPGTNTYNKAADSDPQAVAILNKLRAKYDSYTAVAAEFDLIIEQAEQQPFTQSGRLARQANKYHLKLGMQEAIGDGQAIYLILHDNKDVQINNLPDPGEEALLTPDALFNFFDKDKFVAALRDERSEQGTILQYIELKPVDTGADYSKLRVVIDKRAQALKQVIAFGKDGSRYTFVLKDITPNPNLPASEFAFDKADFPDYYVEDLRY
jgi:outer membrane lipoprotein carrier protein